MQFLNLKYTVQMKIMAVEKLLFSQVFTKEEAQSVLHEPLDCAVPRII